MDAEDIRTRLTPIFRDVFADDALVVTATMSASDVPKWDSLSHINLIYAVEKAFGVRFSIRDARSMKDVGELIALIRKKAVQA